MIAGIVYRCVTAPIALIGIVHVACGVAVLVAPEAAKISALSGPMMLGMPPLAMAGVLIAVGVAAIYSQMPWVKNEYRILQLAFPQQFYLLIQFIGVVDALMRAAYPDGYIPVPGNEWASRWFILADQSALLAFCLSHTFEVIAAKVLRIPTRREFELRLLEKMELDRELADVKKQLTLYKDTTFWIGLTKDLDNGKTVERKENVAREQEPRASA
jgi:hypothetical protein